MNLDKKTMLKIIFIILVAALLFVCLPRIGEIFAWIGGILDVFTPFTIGLCMAFIINIPLRLIEKKAFRKLNRKRGETWLKIRRPICLTLSILFFVLVITLLLVIIIPAFKTAIEKFIEKLPGYMVTLEGKIAELITRVTGKPADESFKLNWETASNTVINLVKSEDFNAIDNVVGIVTGAVSGIFNVVLGFVFAIYILASKETLGRQVRGLLYSIFKREKVDKSLHFLNMANSTFSKFVVGQCTEAVILGLLCALGMLIFRMPYIPVVSCIIAITALVPVFGAFIGTSLGAFIILLDEPMKALWFIIFIIVLQQIETNLIYPKVMGKSIGLPGLWVLFAVTIGGGLFGAVGLLIGVPVCSVIYTFSERWVNSRLIERNIDSDRLHKNNAHNEHVSKAESARKILEKIKSITPHAHSKSETEAENDSTTPEQSTENTENTENDQ